MKISFKWKGTGFSTCNLLIEICRKGQSLGER